ncbi:NifU family protein [Candidatus Dependentiae bacterium]|nr:NifU family protein [Candidatus Dependentiae bacterium]
MGIISSPLDQNQALVERIKEQLTTIRPLVNLHEGDIEFVSFIDGVVSLRLHGACVGCPLSFYTLKLGIEQQLQESIPEVREVVAVD